MSEELEIRVSEENEGEEEELHMRRESKIYRSPRMKEGMEFSGTIYDNCHTMTSTLREACTLYPKNQVYGVRISDKGDFDWMTYESLWNRLRIIAKSLKEVLDDPKPQTRFGIILDTCKEWSLMQHSSYMLNCIVVGITPSTGPLNMIKIINENEMEVVVVHNNQLDLIEEISEACPALKKLIVVGYPESKKEQKVLEGLELIPFDFLHSKYEDDYEDFEIEYPGREDLCLQIYTSGSTGEPKGVQLSHQAVVSCIAATFDNNENYKFTTTLNFVSFLPLSHLNEQSGHHLFLFIGSKVAYGSLTTLMSRDGFVGDLEAIEPVIFSGVPRVWETLRKAIEFKVSQYTWPWRWAFNHFLQKRLNSLKQGKNEEFYFENMIFGKIRNMFGKKVAILVSASSPLAEETQLFIQAIMGNKKTFIQIYGISEGVASLTMQNTSEFDGTGNVGWVLKGNEIKLVECPELNYHTHDPESGEPLEEPEGEIWYRGKQMFYGYFKKPKITAESMEDGWYKTGDVGRFMKCGKLQIIDRIKNVVKIGNGEFVAVEAMEARYVTSPFIRPNGICVIPDGFKSYICAIVCLDVSYTLNYINEHLESGTKLEDIDEAIEKHKKRLKEHLLKDLARITKHHRRPQYETIVDLTFYNDEWNPMNGLTSTTYKLFRRKIAKKYRGDLNRMYKIEGSQITSEQETKEKSPEEDRLEIMKMFPGIQTKQVEIILQLSKMMDRSVTDIDFFKPIQATGIDSLTTVLVLNTLKKTTGKSIRVSLLATKPLGLILSKLFQLPDDDKFMEKKKEEETEGEEGEGEEEDEIMFEEFEEFVNLDEEFKKLDLVLEEIRSKKIFDEDVDLKTIKGVFVTGASGFLGVQLVKELLGQFGDENVKIYCLIRPQSSERFKSKFKDEDRVVVIHGDLSKPFFGYENEEVMIRQILFLGSSETKEPVFQTILHGGSLVNHFFSYDDLYSTNVASFYDILRLSSLRIPIHLVSSTVAYLDKDRKIPQEELFDIKYPKLLGYGASKFASDCLALKTNLKFGPSLGRPVCFCHRPSFIGTSRKDKESFNTHDWFAVFVKEMIKHKLVCDKGYFQNPFDMVSLDFCSQMIVSILKNKHDEFFEDQRYSNEEDVNKKIFFEYSLRNISLLEVSKMIESLTGQKFEVVDNYKEYFEVIRKRVSLKLQEAASTEQEEDLTEVKIILPFLNMMEQNPILLDQFKHAASVCGPNENLVEYIQGREDLELERKFDQDDLKDFLVQLWNQIHPDKKI